MYVQPRWKNLYFSIPAFVLATVSFSVGRSSWAGGWYYEFGGGGALVNQAQGFFGTRVPSAPRMGYGLNLLVAKNLAREGQEALLQIHLGLRQTYISASRDQITYAYTPTYAFFRLESPRFYFGGGATPIVFRQISTPQVGGAFALAPGAIALEGEFGLLWRVVPFFHIALESSAHFVQSGGGLSPKPALLGGIQFRIFMTSDLPEGRSRTKYDGWRYPFGLELFGD